jgi:hypothetical protein
VNRHRSSLDDEFIWIVPRQPPLIKEKAKNYAPKIADFVDGTAKHPTAKITVASLRSATAYFIVAPPAGRLPWAPGME